MKVIVAKECGFCFGVRNAVKLAEEAAGEASYCLGNIIHNERVIKKLENLGIKTVSSLDEVDEGKVIIRSHGAPPQTYDEIERKGLTLIDATCPYVKNIHKIVSKHFSEGFHIVIIGDRTHPEVEAINGWCKDSATIISTKEELDGIDPGQKLCFVAQTTFSKQKYDEIVEKIRKLQYKTVEIFDTICYTTIQRQFEAGELARFCDVMLVIGSRTSSNTGKLYRLCSDLCKRTFLVEELADLQKIIVKPDDTVGITAGASAPDELIMEVRKYMGQNFEEVLSQEFVDAVEESLVSYKEGLRVTGTVISADDAGIHLNIGGKKDGLIHSEDVNVDGSYNPEDYKPGMEISAIITNKNDKESGCIILSKKKVDLILEGDKQVEEIRNGEIFELAITKDTKGGLLSKMGTYTVFIPASQIREKVGHTGGFIKDLKVYVGKTLRLTALEIDDEKHKIVASQRKVLEDERKEREEIFWTHVQPNVVVSGVVKRITNFGAFVSVDGFDCLAHIVDLSWSHIKKVDDVLKIGETYDFLVLKVDKENNRVSLGYKQLQKHPFLDAMERHPVGSVVTGKVTSVVPFGAFVEIEPHIEGLVHVSEAAHGFVKSIADIVKVGDEVEVKVMSYDEDARKITLSMKACIPEDQIPEGSEAPYSESASEGGEATARTERKPRAPKKTSRTSSDSDEQKEWNEETSNNPFADLLKDIDVD